MSVTNLLNKKMADDSVKTVTTRLGVVEYKSQDVFMFDNGLYGFDNCRDFILTFLPYEGTPENYRFLQSIDQPDIAMIVMNIMVKDDVNNPGLIAISDLEPHLKQYNVQLDDVAIFLVVAIRSENGQQRVSVNTKAPILLVPNQQLGWQIILENSHYQVSHYLT